MSLPHFPSASGATHTECSGPASEIQLHNHHQADGSNTGEHLLHSQQSSSQSVSKHTSSLHSTKLGNDPILVLVRLAPMLRIEEDL